MLSISSFLSFCSRLLAIVKLGHGLERYSLPIFVTASREIHLIELYEPISGEWLWKTVVVCALVLTMVDVFFIGSSLR